MPPLTRSNNASNRRTKATRLGSLVLVAAFTAAISLAPSPTTASAKVHAKKSVHCKSGKVKVRMGKTKTCVPKPGRKAKDKKARIAAVSNQWYPGSMRWHVWYWPGDGSTYRASDGTRYYVDEWREQWSYNLATHYLYYRLVGSRFVFWGDNVCGGLGNLRPCTWFAA